MSDPTPRRLTAAEIAKLERALAEHVIPGYEHIDDPEFILRPSTVHRLLAERTALREALRDFADWADMRKPERKPSVQVLDELVARAQALLEEA